MGFLHPGQTIKILVLERTYRKVVTTEGPDTEETSQQLYLYSLLPALRESYLFYHQ